MATTTNNPPVEFLNGDAEKGDLTPTASYPSSHSAQGDALVTEKSRGVRQMEALQSRLSTKYRILLYGSFALLAYVMSLDQYTNSSYLTAATSVSFDAHLTLTTISAVKSVFQAVSQPPVAKIADGAGRIEAYSMCVFFYVIGYIVVASAKSVYAYAAGNSIYVIGITGLFLLQNIIIADISSTRNRLFWSIFPSLPGVINVWVSGNIAQSLLGAQNQRANAWRWGIAMFTIIVPICATPILLTLGIGMRKTKEQRTQDRQEQRAPQKSWKEKALATFWQLDIIGLLLLVAGFGMLLTIITIANGKGSHWNDPHSIALITVGGFLVICFILWERFGARHPLIPFTLLTNRTVIAAFVIALVHPAAGGVIGSYFYTYVLVAADQTTLSAKRITSLASFTGTLTAAAMGLVARYVRYLKPIIIFGFCVEILSFGLMIRYRGAGASTGDLAAVQVVRGLGVGAISFPVQAAIQSVTKREYIGAVTAGYLTIFYLSGGVGSAIGGGIWSNLVPGKMREYIADPELAAKAYSNPIGLISKYPAGTAVREAMSRAQGETQRVLSITGTCLAAVGLLTALAIQWVKLTDEQSLTEVEESEVGKLGRRGAEKGDKAPAPREDADEVDEK